jgi:DNA polymerase III alpha subunit
MDITEDVGLVKLDVLGLKTMTTQAYACESSGVSHNELDHVPFDDEATLEAFSENRFGGIFQYDSPSARRLCRGFRFNTFADVCVMTALNRPGPMKTGLAQAYLERATDPSKTPAIHPIYDRVTAETFGVLIYQEQVVALARELGFRKKVAKKKGVSEDHAMFVTGAMEQGMEEVDAERLFNSIIGFGSYAFNKSHAYAYGMIAYQLMYLKVHHPAAFYAAILAIKDKDEDLLRIAAEARRTGIPVEAPEINRSGRRYTIHRGEAATIVGSIADIKGIGIETARKIADRKPYTGFLDFYEKTRTGPGRVTKATFRALAQTTALRSLCPNTRLIHTNADKVWDAVVKGFDVELEPTAVDDYERDGLIRVATERYRLFVDEGGRGEFAAVYDSVVEKCSRDLLTPAEVPTEGPDYAFVLARLNDSKLYSEGSGSNTARVSLLAPDGVEIVARADADVLQVCGKAIESKGKMVLALVYARVGYRGGVSYGVERIWLAEDIFTTGPESLLTAVANPTKTRPKDPIAAFAKREIEDTFRLEGMVLRVRKHKDKRGSTMRTVGLLGSEGYIRFFVFSSRCRGAEDLKLLRPGRMVRVGLKKLSGDAACLTHSPIMEV